ncbi:MAG: hypothetical protein A2Y33_03725 [Spirochaetes bacterium GWF1_51_8]|nr:MAG: hypothetical protein A2Y33_03725 [Spirochaetes bacterium GWF1_51_8]
MRLGVTEIHAIPHVRLYFFPEQEYNIFLRDFKKSFKILNANVLSFPLCHTFGDRLRTQRERTKEPREVFGASEVLRRNDASEMRGA